MCVQNVENTFQQSKTIAQFYAMFNELRGKETQTTSMKQLFQKKIIIFSVLYKCRVIRGTIPTHLKKMHQGNIKVLTVFHEFHIHFFAV